MDEILFYIISVCLFCVIIKEIMGIFFVKKDVPVLIFIIVWIMFLLIDIIGVKFIIEPIFLLGIESVNSFCFLHVFVSGEYKKETNLDCNYQPIRNDYRDNGRLFIYIF